MSHEHNPTGTTGPGTVILELGAEIGVLVMYTPEELHGHEIEISREGHRRVHSMVRRRVAASGTSYAAVYPGLPAGHYTVWRDDVRSVGFVTIEGGEVARFDWPADEG